MRLRVPRVCITFSAAVGTPGKDFSHWSCFNRKNKNKNGWPKSDTRNFHHLWPLPCVPLAQGTPSPSAATPPPRCILRPPPGPFRLPSHLRSFVPFATRLSIESVNQPIIERPCAGPGRFLCGPFSFRPQRHFGTFPRQKAAEGRKEVPPCGHRKDDSLHRSRCSSGMRRAPCTPP